MNAEPLTVPEQTAYLAEALDPPPSKPVAVLGTETAATVET
jgi:hypothetical protein